MIQCRIWPKIIVGFFASTHYMVLNSNACAMKLYKVSLNKVILSSKVIMINSNMIYIFFFTEMGHNLVSVIIVFSGQCVCIASCVYLCVYGKISIVSVSCINYRIMDLACVFVFDSLFVILHIGT